jgi:hypothetical protein
MVFLPKRIEGVDRPKENVNFEEFEQDSYLVENSKYQEFWPKIRFESLDICLALDIYAFQVMIWFLVKSYGL